MTRHERADFKRLVELCSGNREWLKAFLEEPKKWISDRNLRMDPQMALKAVKIYFCQEQGSNPYIEAYQEIIHNIYQYVDGKTSMDRMVNPKLKGWYQRQIGRNRFQSSISRHMSGMFYVPVSFELTDGCSIGCQFCCLSAKPLERVYQYHSEHDLLWRRILIKSKELIGDIVDYSICYFATEPLDNPGYEDFLKSYHDIFHCYPQTTTAAAARNVERTKRLLDMIGERELAHAAVRFSVTSLEGLENIHNCFSSDELEYVELLTNNPESLNSYSKSGRSIQLADTMEEKRFLDGASSICTNGFVVNMPAKTITLVSPHRPDHNHPVGMKVYEKRCFQNEEDYGTVLQEMIDCWMPLKLPEDKPLFLADYLTVSFQGFQMKVTGEGISRIITLSKAQQRCFKMLLEQQISLQEISSREHLTEYESQQLKNKAAILYDAGYLEENRI